MKRLDKFYIGGTWVSPLSDKTLDVINPSDELVIAQVSLGTSADVDAAVSAAKAAFYDFSSATVAERLSLLERIAQLYQARLGEMAELISLEMGAPKKLASAAQAPAGLGHITVAIELLKNYEFEVSKNGRHIRKEPVGVCGLITPWNWPINQIACKVAPALAAGCTMVLKPSEVAPLSAYLFAEILAEAGVPKGVFNLVNGLGEEVGKRLSEHPDIDMMSFTGSTRAGISVAELSAPTVKRVTQELGGKSANILLEDADFEKMVKQGVKSCFFNTGQSCNAPTRMLVPVDKMEATMIYAKDAAESLILGPANKDGVTTGPVVSLVQFDRIQALIEKGIDEGATLVTGGLGRPEGLDKGYYIKPTVFAHVDNNMSIAREEIFGPVLSIIGYNSEDEAIEIANDTIYGLSAYVSSVDIDRAKRVACQLRAGNVHINGASADFMSPFGGYKMSGNGREWGVHGFEEFLEVKSILGLRQ
ncbi:aldehyde dehydrogenase family protein [Gammaproteobacteria bacterium 45_16_T64]|nr:aldehyde dehydrogenase family protein [Gammaproteobacteria bacterium 45_16_T64]